MAASNPFIDLRLPDAPPLNVLNNTRGNEAAKPTTFRQLSKFFMGKYLLWGEESKKIKVKGMDNKKKLKGKARILNLSFSELVSSQSLPFVMSLTAKFS